MEEFRLLAKFWNEDGVWNVSAFDLPVAAYGATVDEARRNFEEALNCHFEALKHFNELPAVLAELRAKAKKSDFYEERMQREALVQDFGQERLELCTT